MYRSTDGGKTWTKVLYFDENTGAIQVTIDPTNSSVVYADMWAAQNAPWENGYLNGYEVNLNTTGLYKSEDGGTTWKKLTTGLPTMQDGLGRIGFCIAPSNPKRLYATIDSRKGGGEYRSDDGGNTWIKLSDDIRLWDRGDDFAEIKADPKNADIVYDVNVVVWKSVDGGKTWSGFKGAPGGDDYHRLWINPDNTNIMLLAGDQGAAVTLNGGETWSSWYNQPTAQLYHVSADNDFPYNVYSGQQESGSAGIASRGNDGQITFANWHPVAAEEYGYCVADPKDPNIIYGGKISKYDKRTGQVQDISPDPTHSGKYRFLRTAPMIFSVIDNKTLYFAGNVVFKTTDGGNSWQVISPDLTRTSYDLPKCVGIYSPDSSVQHNPRRGVIYTLAPSPIDMNTIWAGTDDGYIQVTRDGGKTWTNVTPPSITCWNKISLMDASHTDVNTAYAAVNCMKLDDMHPHIYKTTDGGKTWKEIVNGLPDAPINVVKEDPIRKGLLFAGSERAVYVSFDDGEHWQSLRLNMPATSIRDLIIKDNDLVVATHGRSFWILDDITPLRQLTAETMKEKVVLYAPAPAYRVRWDMWPDTPLPGDEPAGKNPPDGAIIDYYLKEKVNSITLDIFDSAGALIRHYSNMDTPYNIPDVNIPLYWVRPQQILSADSGSHRFLWDIRYAPLNVPAEYPISAIVGETAPQPSAPWVLPGKYKLFLKVNDKTYHQSLEIRKDPRIKSSIDAQKKQFSLSYSCYQDRITAMSYLDHNKQDNKEAQQTMVDDASKKDSINFYLKAISAVDFNSIASKLKTLFDNLQNSEEQPTTQCVESMNSLHNLLRELELQWMPLHNRLMAIVRKK